MPWGLSQQVDQMQIQQLQSVPEQKFPLKGENQKASCCETQASKTGPHGMGGFRDLGAWQRRAARRADGLGLVLTRALGNKVLLAVASDLERPLRFPSA